MKVEYLAKLLGYAGLIPFVVFAIGSWFRLPLVDNAHYALLTYAAVILSFMGAIHWGVAMAKQVEQQEKLLGFSVLPALLGWLALLLPQSLAYSILIISFSGLYMLDRFYTGLDIFEQWYALLRLRLTSVVVCCLLIAAFSPTSLH